jgi:hypothetical protein
MTFTEELYEKISNLYVGMTVRGFSELCGKSPSYYGSIKSQNLELSTSSIAHLMEGIEERKMVAPASTQFITQLNNIQLFIANEIAIRHHRCTESQNIKIRHILLEAVSNLADRELDNRTPTPVFIGLN